MKMLGLPRAMWMIGTTRAVRELTIAGGALGVRLAQYSGRVYDWNRRRFSGYVKAARSEMLEALPMIDDDELRRRVEQCLKDTGLETISSVSVEPAAPPSTSPAPPASTSPAPPASTEQAAHG